MSSLSHCLKKHGLSEHEAAILRGKVDALAGEGYEAHQAAIQAVNDHLDELHTQRAEIVKQIPAAREAPVAEEPAEEPVAADAPEPKPRIRSPKQLANDLRLKRERNNIDPARDHLFTAIGRLGGLDTKEARSTWGLDPKDRFASGVFGKPTLRHGGRSLDDMAQALADRGYLPKDEHGKVDLHDFEEAFQRHHADGDVFAAQGHEARFEKRADEIAQVGIEAELSDKELADSGYNEITPEEHAIVAEAVDDGDVFGMNGKEMSDAEIENWFVEGEAGQAAAGEAIQNEAGHQEPHQSPPSQAPPDFALSGESEAEIKAREAAEAKNKKAADDKRIADLEVDHFDLQQQVAPKPEPKPVQAEIKDKDAGSLRFSRKKSQYDDAFAHLPDAVREDSRYREPSAAMRNVDTARALRGELAALEKDTGTTLSLDDQGNVNVVRANRAGMANTTLTAIKSWAEARELGVFVRQSAMKDWGGNLTTGQALQDLGFQSEAGLGAYVAKSQPKTIIRNRAPIPTGPRDNYSQGTSPNTVEWSYKPRGLPLFSRGSETSKGIPAAKVEEAIRPIRAGWKNAPAIKVVQKVVELPARYRAKADTEGLFDPATNTVWLVGDNLRSARHAQFVVLHEILGHYGLHGVFGDALTPLLNRIFLENKDVREAAQKVMAQWGYSRAVATEEVLADMAGTGIKPTGWQRVVAFIRDALRKLGFDLKLSDADVMGIVAQAGKYVREGRERSGATGQVPAFQRSAPTFYSELAAKVAGMRQEAGPAGQWKGLIDNLKGVKKDEIEWSGVQDWLALQSGKVTREQVLDYLKQNGVNVQEVMLAYGEEPNTKFAGWQLPGGENYRELLLTLPEKQNQAHEARSQRVKQLIADRDALFAEPYSQDQARQLRNINTQIDLVMKETHDRTAFRAGHYGDVAPNVLAHVRFNERTAPMTDAQRTRMNELGARHLKDMMALSDTEHAELSGLLRVRDAGNKVLFIEEIQSDWAQKGRKEGFAAPAKPVDTTGWTAFQNKFGWGVDDAEGNNRGRELTANSAEEAIAQTASFYGEKGKSGIPPAPFVTKTEAWTALAIKRMIRYAAENGFDKIAWATGEQSADRYDLSKHVDSLRWEDNGARGFNITAYKNDDPVINKTGLTAQQLEDTIGKEIAEKIASHHNATTVREDGTAFGDLSNLDLKVGGEGMAAFYDRIVPNVANDILKKLGGGRVGPVRFGETLLSDADIDYLAGLGSDAARADDPMRDMSAGDQPGFDITPALRAKAMQGMPLFSRSQESTPAFLKWFGASHVTGLDNKPAVIYHGTPADFSVFDETKLGGLSHHPTSGLGFFFSQAPDTANKFAAEGSVMPVYLAIQNPYFMTVTEAGGLLTNEDALAKRTLLQREGYDGIRIAYGGIWVAFDKGQIKSAIGNSGAFDKANADIRFSRSSFTEPVRDAIDRFTTPETAIPSFAKGMTPEQQATLRKAGLIYDTPTLAGRVKEVVQDFRQSFVQGVVDQFAPLKDLDQKAYMLARLAAASDGGVEALLLYGKPYLDGGALNVKMGEGGFLDALKKLSGEHDRFFAWVAGNRAAELKDAGKENLLTDDDIGFLKDLNQGKMADGRARAIVYGDAMTRLREFNKATLDIAEQSGLIDSETRPLWESEFYVPFYRVLQEGTGGPTIKSGLVNQYAFKKLKGGTQNLNDLFKNTLMNWSHLLSAAAKNRAAIASMDAALDLGIAREVPAGTKDSVRVMREGEAHAYLIDDPHVMDAITALEWAGFGGMVKPLQTFKRWLTFGVTISPTFKVANLMRDTIAAIGQSKLSYNPAKNLAAGWKGTMQGSQTYASMLAGGGMFRYGTLLEGDRVEHVRRLVAAGIKDEHVLDNPEKIKALAQKVWDAYQEFGDRSENVNRAALYDQLRAQGMDHLEASYMARDLLDFSLQGKWAIVRFLTQTVPFMNARLQGLYKLGRAAKEDPKRFAVVSGAVALASIALMLLQGDDDDWKRREDWDRNNYWWVKIGGIAYRIPKPFEIGSIGTLAERTLELAIDKDMTFKRYGRQWANTFANTFAMSPVPQLMKPLVDVYANKDSFTGRPIESAGMERLKKEDRVHAGTSELAKLLGKAGLPDPLQLAQGQYEALSPVQLDQMVNGYFGSLGMGVNFLVDAMLRPLLGRADKPAMTVSDAPILGRFVRNLPEPHSRYVSELYDNARQIEETFASYRDALKRGDNERAAEIVAEDGNAIRLHHAARHAMTTLGHLNRAIKRVDDDRTMNSDAKRERIDQLRLMQEQIAKHVSVAP